jgi:hypothetical protein
MDPSDIELVVAHYEEDLGWLNNVPAGLRVTVYDKGTSSSRGVRLANGGREAHTYLHHLVERYDALARVTVFAQGKPFDHVPDFHRWLRRLSGDEERVEGFRWLGFIIDEDDTAGSRLFCSWGKNSDGRSLDLDAFWRSLWARPAPDSLVFYPGGHFAVTADRVRAQDVSFYGKARSLSVSFPDAAHCFERCWDRVFEVDGIPGRFRSGPFPVFFRPIRRLGISWEDVR